MFEEFFESDGESGFKNNNNHKQANKMSISKTWILLSFFQWINYNNVVAAKQIYFLSAFLKSWVHISDNLAGEVGSPQQRDV